MTKPNSSLIDCALDAIRTGKLVAIPTETVYGLGADGVIAMQSKKFTNSREGLPIIP